MWFLLACTDKGAVVTDSTPAPKEWAPPDDPLVIVVLADDLGDNFLWSLDTVVDTLEPVALRYTRAYVTEPLCCPCRAGLLTGGFTTRFTGVYENDLPNGGAYTMTDSRTLGTELQRIGVATGLIGKYLNGYELEAPYVPPGWDEFTVPTYPGDWTDTQLVTGSSTPGASAIGTTIDTAGEFLTAWEFERALAFLDAHPSGPTLLLVTPQSPHLDGISAAEDVGTWAGYEWRPPSFDEADTSDKPAWIQERVPGTTEDVWDSQTVEMLENAESLDRGVGLLLAGLTDRGLDDRAVVIFTSDNGMLHGEHRLATKSLAYEESARIPLLVRAPGLPPREDDRLVAMNLDLPATILDLFGATNWGEGQSLVPAFVDPDAAGRDHVFLESGTSQVPLWAGLVTEQWKWVQWESGETELYDLDADPAELESLHAAPPDGVDTAGFAAEVAAEQALMVTTSLLPSGELGAPWTTTLERWGGTDPVTWSLVEGALPAGLTLSADGVIAGTPEESGSFAVSIAVTDTSVSPITGAPQTYERAFTLDIGEVPPVEARRDGEVVRMRFPIRPGEHARVCATGDAARDTVARCQDAAPEGRVASATLPLSSARTWWWWIERDGVILPGQWAPTLR